MASARLLDRSSLLYVKLVRKEACEGLLVKEKGKRSEDGEGLVFESLVEVVDSDGLYKYYVGFVA